MKRTDPAVELLTLGGTYILALKAIHALTTTPPGPDPLSQERQIEEIREIATAALEHRRPHLSEETIAYLATQQSLDTQLLNPTTKNRLQANDSSHHQASVKHRADKSTQTRYSKKNSKLPCDNSL